MGSGAASLPLLMWSVLVSGVQGGASASPLFLGFSQRCLVCGWMLVDLVSGTEVRRMFPPQKMVAGWSSWG